MRLTGCLLAQSIGETVPMDEATDDRVDQAHGQSCCVRRAREQSRWRSVPTVRHVLTADHLQVVQARSLRPMVPMMSSNPLWEGATPPDVGS